MTNNQDLEQIRQSFGNLALVFKDAKEEQRTYIILKELSEKKLNAKDMLIQLNDISQTHDYSPDIEDFLYRKYEQLRSLAELEIEKDRLQEVLKSKHREYEEKARSMNFDYHVNLDDFNIEFENDVNDRSMKETIEQLQNNIRLIEERIRTLEEKRKTGDELESVPIEKYNKLNNIQENGTNVKMQEMDEGYKKMNDQAQEHAEYTNITPADMMVLYNYAKDKQTDKSSLNIEVNYRNDGSVEVIMTHEGTEIDQSVIKSVCYFPDVKSFEEDALSQLISAHNNSFKQDVTVSENEINSTNSMDEELKVPENANIDIETGERDHDKGYQRKRIPPKPYNSGYSSTAFYLILGFVIIITIITILLLVI